MRILLTGAGGFVGSRLATRLISLGELGGVPFIELVLLDERLPELPPDPRVRRIEGNLVDPRTRAAAIEGGVDLLFHLASVLGGAAERDFELGRAVNFQAQTALFDAVRRQTSPPRIVYASTIGIFGVPQPSRIDDDTVPVPSMSYGAHKLIGEILLDDFTRRGWADARSLRLPGIVARPRGPSGLISAFMSDVMHAAAAAETFTVPVSERATVGLMSVGCCVDNLIHAAVLPEDCLPTHRAWTLPLLRLTMGELVDALVEVFGADTRARIRFEPQEAVEAQFGRLPPVTTPLAESLGFRRDATAAELVRRALER